MVRISVMHEVQAYMEVVVDVVDQMCPIRETVNIFLLVTSLKMFSGKTRTEIVLFLTSFSFV